MISLFRSASELMVQYAHYHRDRRNIVTHLVGIPLIVLSIGMLLSLVSFDIAGHTATLAGLLWLLSTPWYLTRGNLLLGLATSLVNGALIALAHTPDAATGWGLNAVYDAAWFPGLAVFVIGWIIQFVGHIFEGRKPAFVDDVVGLLVGPMFVVGEVLMMAGMLRSMHSLIEAQAGATR
ncbi:MAG: DUF962 domain-containing protein [Burkholderiales bacterium]|jgi:uncharacterized membrane protein YGL010W